MTRAEAQRQVDDLYGRGQIERDEWSRRFDELSSTQWTAEGPAKATPKKETKKETKK